MAEKNKSPYGIRLGQIRLEGEKKELKAELESIAFDKEIETPELIRRILRGYVRKVKTKAA